LDDRKGDSPDLATYRRIGLPAQHVTLVGRGPMGMTIRSPDRETANAYLEMCPAQ
jgi:hypothetical protein